MHDNIRQYNAIWENKWAWTSACHSVPWFETLASALGTVQPHEISEPAAARRKDVAVVLLLHSQLVSGSPGDLHSLVVQPYLTFPTASANSSMVIRAAGGRKRRLLG